MESEIRNNVSSIKLSRGMTGKVGWEIKIYSEDVVSIPKELKELDEAMKKRFPAELPKEDTVEY